MPQMMPINWILSFFFFILIFIIFNIMNYFIYVNKNYKNNIFLKKNKNLYWKW
uniref:ATP synthase F0 subunit 8 n=1 Tax=Polythlipta liquidalis TaxID=1418736 RepID=UPI002410336A|nr:ATP synthase F0 subunit 8 [Polythlipta liquidalis]WET30818.1 ATP synthase F0 subunit 8 [Polythlipta liquidalis]